MQIQAAEVKIHAAHRCDLIVTDKTFCVNKSRRVLINFYPALYERCIVGLREQENHLLVRNPRRHNPHVHAPLGCQRQRILLARALCQEPEVIVLDEPTAMLDPIGRSEVLRTIRDLNRKKGVTVVLITHHMDEAAQADRLVVMTKGRVIADGPPRQVFQDVEGLRSVGLTVPDTTQLLWELRQEGLDVPLDALSDEECAQALCQLLNAASKKGSQP